MIEQGLIRQAGNGTFYILPLLQRSVQKAIDLVDHYMQRHAGAEKLGLPILTSADLWRKSGRLETASAELMTTTDRHGKKQILGPVSNASLNTVKPLAKLGICSFPLTDTRRKHHCSSGRNLAGIVPAVSPQAVPDIDQVS